MLAQKLRNQHCVLTHKVLQFRSWDDPLSRLQLDMIANDSHHRWIYKHFWIAVCAYTCGFHPTLALSWALLEDCLRVAYQVYQNDTSQGSLYFNQ